VLAAGTAAAQPQPPVVGGGRPTFSPYLNLLRGSGVAGGAGPALNYYGLVRPQIQFNQQSNALQQQVTQNQQAIQGVNSQLNQGADPTLPATGRGATFGFYSHYYPAFAGRGGGSGTLGAAGGSGVARLGQGGGFGQQQSASGNRPGGQAGGAGQRAAPRGR
jgi:hypothetical protein